MKIAFVGGGSLTWTPELVTDLALTPEIHGATLALQDINAESLERMLALSRRICQEARSQIRVEATLEREVALRDADYVIFSVAIGGLQGVRADLEIPARYGIRLPVGMNVGPAGINRALRHISATIELCRQMEAWCPGAWLLNLTNPMTQLCRAAVRETGVRTIIYDAESAVLGALGRDRAWPRRVHRRLTVPRSPAGSQSSPVIRYASCSW